MRIASPCKYPCYTVVYSLISLKRTDVCFSNHHLSAEKVFSSMIIDCDTRVYAWRTGPESISTQGIPRLQINISACNAGLDKHGIGGYVTGVRLMGPNVEVEIIPK